MGELAGAIGRVLSDDVLRSRLSKGAATRARSLTWDATARRALEALAEEARSPSRSAVDADDRRGEPEAVRRPLRHRAGPQGARAEWLAHAQAEAGDHGIG